MKQTLTDLYHLANMKAISTPNASVSGS